MEIKLTNKMAAMISHKLLVHIENNCFVDKIKTKKALLFNLLQYKEVYEQHLTKISNLKYEGITKKNPISAVSVNRQRIGPCLIGYIPKSMKN